MAFLRVMRDLTLAIVVMCHGSSALASEKYPAHPVTIVVPFAAGGPTDILVRIIAQSIGPSLEQQVVVGMRPERAEPLLP